MDTTITRFGGTRATVALACALALALFGMGAAGAEETSASGTNEPAAKSAASPAPRAAPPGVDYWQPDWMVRELWGPGHMPRGMMVRLLRQTTYMQYGVPKAYEGAQSTVAAGAQTVAAGRALYQAKCAGCHGANGLGDGEAANALSPSPALLAYMIRRPIAVDEYLLWSISEGGAQFESNMPAFKDDLSKDDIWRIIAFMRAGFPEDGAGGSSKPDAARK